MKTLEYRKYYHTYEAHHRCAVYFHKSLAKYGADKFEWSVLEEVPTDQNINDREKYWISFYKSYDPNYGYNLTYGGDNTAPNKETREKMSKSQKGKLAGEKHPRWGKHCSDITKKRISDSLQGHPVSEETLKKLVLSHIGQSAWNKGKPMSEETKLKLSRVNKGKKHSNATRQKISAAGKGRIVTEETRKKIGMKHKGKCISKEARQKMSDSRKKYLQLLKESN